MHPIPSRSQRRSDPQRLLLVQLGALIKNYGLTVQSRVQSGPSRIYIRLSNAIMKLHSRIPWIISDLVEYCHLFQSPSMRWGSLFRPS